ncbi:MAG: GAF domain-containing protein [Anaerolineae bacterium]|nr:GAF domain-containing protein [Anaerolineae bacterium]
MNWRRLTEWGLLFLLLVAAVWAATQSRDAPLIILLAALTVIALQFSLPPAMSSVGLLPVVMVSGYLVVGWGTAVPLFTAGFVLAELSRPLWRPLWELTPQAGPEAPTIRQRFIAFVIHLLALAGGVWFYTQRGGSAPLSQNTANAFPLFLNLMAGFGLVYATGLFVWWLAQRQSPAAFFRDNGLLVMAAGFLALPFALLGGIVYALGGLPPFVVFCLGAAVFAVLFWLSWQRRYSLAQQVAQFAILNRSEHSLRETLELPEVLRRTGALVTELVSADRLALFLQDQGVWSGGDPAAGALLPVTLDDLTGWVATHGRALHLYPANFHFADRHHLALPHPPPAVWLGLPLLLDGDVLGVMVLQRWEKARQYSRWQLELLHAVAAQVSVAVRNARLHGEIVRLYTLTDEALAQRVQQLQALLNALAEAVVMVDRQGRVMLANPITAVLLDNTLTADAPLDMAAAPWLGFTESQLTARLQELADGTLRGGYGRAHFTPPTSPRRVLERQEAPVFGREGQLIGWLLLFRDVTEAQELAERREDLTRMIVHDLRNPLTTMSTTLQLAQERLAAQGDGDTRPLLQNAYGSSQDLLDMVDSLMDMHRLEAGRSIVDPDAMRLPPLVEAVAARLQPLLAHKGIVLTITSPPDLPPIWADAELVRRVLVNLLDNALKFTPANGRIAITLQPEPAQPGYEPGARCFIQDSGPGVPPAFREQAFDRYTRTNPGGAPVRGAGLGLTFCKMVVEAQHGRIWVEDAPGGGAVGGGSQFVFTLPGVPVWDEETIPEKRMKN